MRAVGLILFAAGGLTAGLNLYISFLRYPLHVALGGTRQSYHWVSGLPAVGSILLLLALCVLQWSWFSWLALALFGLDTGGLLWFVAVMWWSQARRSDGA